MKRLVKLNLSEYTDKFFPIIKDIKEDFVNDNNRIVDFLEKSDNLNLSNEDDWLSYVEQDLTQEIYDEFIKKAKETLNVNSDEEVFSITGIDFDGWIKAIEETVVKSEEFDDLQIEIQKEDKLYRTSPEKYYGAEPRTTKV